MFLFLEEDLISKMVKKKALKLLYNNVDVDQDTLDKMRVSEDFNVISIKEGKKEIYSMENPFELINCSNSYDFFRTNEYLKDNVMLLTFGGSISYGTNTPNSDIDVRGIYYNTPKQLLGFDQSEQVDEPETDTVVYSLKKVVELLCGCNPNVVEVLGCEDSQYLVLTEDGKMLKDNVDMFMSKVAMNSFGGYAIQQLRRLQNAVARDSLTDLDREKHIRASLENQMYHIKNVYSDFKGGKIEFDIVDNQLAFSVDLKDYDVRDFNAIYSEISNCVRQYDKLNHRNKKKDDAHLDKHAMHLVRLLLTGTELLSKGVIRTFRRENVLELMDIRNGKYREEDRTYMPEFFEMVNELENGLKYAAKHSVLPEKPNKADIEELVMEINRKRLKQLDKNSTKQSQLLSFIRCMFNKN